MKRRIGVGVLLVFVAVFCIAGLGRWALMDADEATYARVFHESLQRDDFLSFTYLGEHWFDKPPLYFWFARATVSVFGEDEFALRLPSALATVWAVLLVWLIARHETDDDFTAFFAGTILLSTGYFIFAGRQLRLDVPATAAILFAFYCFLKGLSSRKWLAGVGAGIAAGILMKSVIGLLVLPFIFIYAAFRKRWDWLKSGWFWLGNALAVLLVVPWHVYEYAKFGPSFWQSYFVFNVVERVGGSVLSGAETAPFFYHLKQLFIVANPWFLVFIILGCVALMMRLSGLKDDGRKAYPYFAIAAFTVVIFYIPKTRLLYYFIPALPFLAIGMAVYLRPLLAKHPRIFGTMVCILCCVGFGNTIFQISSQVGRGFFLQPLPAVSRYMVAEDEKKVALLRKAEGLPLYIYEWNFVSTLLYYNDNGNGTTLLRTANGAAIESPALLLIPSPLFKGLSSLPVTFSPQANAEVLYAGPAATLIRISGS